MSWYNVYTFRLLIYLFTPLLYKNKGINTTLYSCDMTKIILNNSNSDKTFIHLGLTMSTSSSSSAAASKDNVEILLAVYQFKPGSPLQKISSN